MDERTVKAKTDTQTREALSRLATEGERIRARCPMNWVHMEAQQTHTKS
jgi:hypothetical protein